MSDEIVKMKRAKMYVDYLISGVDPVDKENIDLETFQNERVIACFKYISKVLERDIYIMENKTSRSHIEFFISDEQIRELKPTSFSRKISDIADEINKVTATNGTKKISGARINDWLEDQGYLCKSDLKSRMATDAGKSIGIISERAQRATGEEYYANRYTTEAQEFIIQHLKEIAVFRKEKASADENNITLLDYPHGCSVKYFIEQHSDKCIITSIGSCDAFAENGSYISLLLYKGKSKVLNKTGIKTSSANKCILTGIFDAVSMIKSSTDVIILTSTPLGFQTHKSINRDLCEDIVDTLLKKECSVSAAVCNGKASELNAFVKSFLNDKS